MTSIVSLFTFQNNAAEFVKYAVAICYLMLVFSPALRPLRKSNPPRIQGETAGKDQNNIPIVNDDPGKLSKVIYLSVLHPQL